MMIDSLFGRTYTCSTDYGELEFEIGGTCIFDEASPSNGMHYHNCYEIAYVVGGKGCYIREGKKIPLSRGTVFIAEPDVQHEIIYEKNGNGRGLELVYMLFKVHRGKLSDSHDLWAMDEGNVDAILRLIQAYKMKKEAGETRLLKVFGILLVEMIDTLLSDMAKANDLQDQTSKSLIDIAMIYIRENIHRKLSVSEVAKVTGTSMRNLQYLFRHNLDMTVVGYINERKINLACSYLKMNHTVANTARMVGVEEVSQFSRLFKQKVGISPKKYQKAMTGSGVRFAALTDDKEWDGFVHKES